jgi:hypothetical protein
MPNRSPSSFANQPALLVALGRIDKLVGIACPTLFVKSAKKVWGSLAASVCAGLRKGGPPGSESRGGLLWHLRNQGIRITQQHLWGDASYMLPGLRIHLIYESV